MQYCREEISFKEGQSFTCKNTNSFKDCIPLREDILLMSCNSKVFIDVHPDSIFRFLFFPPSKSNVVRAVHLCKFVILEYPHIDTLTRLAQLVSKEKSASFTPILNLFILVCVNIGNKLSAGPLLLNFNISNSCNFSIPSSLLISSSVCIVKVCKLIHSDKKDNQVYPSPLFLSMILYTRKFNSCNCTHIFNNSPLKILLLR